MAPFDYKSWLNARWERLPAPYKKGVVWGLGLLGVMGILYIGVSKTPPKKPPPEPKVTRSLFGGRDKSQFAVSQVQSKLEQMERENRELRDKVDRLSDKKVQAPVIDMGKVQADIARQVQEQLSKFEGFVKSYFPLPWWEGIKGRGRVTS